MVASVATVAMAHASAFFVAPTGTQATLSANVGSQVSDPGTLELVLLAIGVPFAFYVIHALIGLIPKGRSRRQ
jgi:hypothetical protein